MSFCEKTAKGAIRWVLNELVAEVKELRATYMWREDYWEELMDVVEVRLAPWYQLISSFSRPVHQSSLAMVTWSDHKKQSRNPNAAGPREAEVAYDRLVKMTGKWDQVLRNAFYSVDAKDRRGRAHDMRVAMWADEECQCWEFVGLKDVIDSLFEQHVPANPVKDMVLDLRKSYCDDAVVWAMVLTELEKCVDAELLADIRSWGHTELVEKFAPYESHQMWSKHCEQFDARSRDGHTYLVASAEAWRADVAVKALLSVIPADKQIEEEVLKDDGPRRSAFRVELAEGLLTKMKNKKGKKVAVSRGYGALWKLLKRAEVEMDELVLYENLQTRNEVLDALRARYGEAFSALAVQPEAEAEVELVDDVDPIDNIMTLLSMVEQEAGELSQDVDRRNLLLAKVTDKYGTRMASVMHRWLGLEREVYVVRPEVGVADVADRLEKTGIGADDILDISDLIERHPIGRPTLGRMRPCPPSNLITPEIEERLAKVAAMPDSEIDYSDAPHNPDKKWHPVKMNDEERMNRPEFKFVRARIHRGGEFSSQASIADAVLAAQEHEQMRKAARKAAEKLANGPDLDLEEDQ